MFLLSILAAGWSASIPGQGAADKNTSEPTCEYGCLSHISGHEVFVWGFGITGHINAEQLGVDLAGVLGKLFSASVSTTSDIDAVLAMIVTATINRGVEFGDVLAPKVFRVIVDTFRDAVKAAVATVEKQSSELAGDVYTVERRSEISAAIDRIFESEFPPPPLVEFTGMRGGASATSVLPAPSEQQVIAYAPLVRRLTPLWRRITSYRRDYPDTWTSDIIQLPEVARLTHDESLAMQEVIKLMPSGRHTLDARSGDAAIRPATCAREHARILLGISQRPDKKLIEIEKRSNGEARDSSPD